MCTMPAHSSIIGCFILWKVLAFLIQQMRSTCFAYTLFTSHVSADISQNFLRDGITMDYQLRGVRFPYNSGFQECLTWPTATIEQQERCGSQELIFHFKLTNNNYQAKGNLSDIEIICVLTSVFVAPVHPDRTLQWDQSLSRGSWSQRSELRKESEVDKVKLLDMCSASEANKELIHHENSVFLNRELSYLLECGKILQIDGENVWLSFLGKKNWP
ncbi:uncharacterized protein [Acropora muricata]|uniref:uncharacterized protein isoform X2 n=1 Tax=Acropora muricata TaxID=159855 RepID=UPI0034E5B73D